VTALVIDMQIKCLSFRFPHSCSQQLEWRVLSMVHGLSDQLRSTCSGVVTSAQGLPGAVQDQLTSAKRSAEELHSSLGTASTITPVILEQSRHHLNQVLIASHYRLPQCFCFAASAKLNIVSRVKFFFSFFFCAITSQLVLPITFL